MTIASAIQSKQQQIADSYTAVSNNGGTLPQAQNLTNLATAISSIPSGGSGITREVKNSVYRMPTTNFTFSLPSDATDIDTYGLYYAFRNCTGLTSVDLSSLTTVSGNNSLNSAFFGCTGLTSVDLSSLTTVSGSYGLNDAFRGCTSLTNLDLSSLTTVSGNYGLFHAFLGCTNLTNLDLSSLNIVSNTYGLYGAFDECTSLTSVDLSSLTTVSGNSGLSYAFSDTKLSSISFSSLAFISGSNAFYYIFNSCENLSSISFPSLTTSSFGSTTNQFTNMLANTGTTTTCTIHFPSNLESTIATLNTYPLFGGTSGYVVLAFDLPATS